MFLLQLAATTQPAAFPAVNIYFLAALLGVITGVLVFWQYLRDRYQKATRSVVTDAIHGIIDTHIDPMNTRLTIIETKMEVFWREVAGDLARVLHHPEPTRWRVDELLETLMNGTLTTAEATELKSYLYTIRDWEEGSPAPFKIFQGEQVAAAILLHTIEHVIERNDSARDTSPRRRTPASHPRCTGEESPEVAEEGNSRIVGRLRALAAKYWCYLVSICTRE